MIAETTIAPPIVAPKIIIDGKEFDADDCVEHLVKGTESPLSEQALCGAEVPDDEPWNTGWPLCQACVAIAKGRMS